MKKLFPAVILAMSMATAAPALADVSSAEFFARDRARNWTGPLVSGPYGHVPSSLSRQRPDRAYVASIIVKHTTRKLGPQWTQSALRIGQIESNFRCNASGPRVRSHRGARAAGALQVMPSSARAMGLDPRRLHECEYGIMAGVEHMRRCLAAGVRTHAQMAACHVAGWAGWNRRLARKSESYKQRYIRMAMR